MSPAERMARGLALACGALSRACVARGIVMAGALGAVAGLMQGLSNPRSLA